MVKKATEKTELRPDFLLKYTKERKAELEQILIEKNTILEDAPDGKLRIDRKGNSLQYYHRKDPSKAKGFYLKRAQDSFAAKGERVRSKSELIIADALNRFKIPYCYEYSISIRGIGTVHPDFICLNVRTRKEYVWEHNGMMSDSEYADYAVNKIEKYTFAGYYPGKNLILSFETSSRPLSSRIIEHYINSYLL